MHNKYFIQQHLQNNEPKDGGIGNRDFEKVLLKNGFSPILFPYQQSFTIIAKVVRFFNLIKFLLALPADSILIFEWPLYAKMYIKLVSYILKYKKSIKLICFITDINGLKDANDKLLEDEKSFFKQFKYFIVHNEKMRTWLSSFHTNAKISCIDFFDFLATPNTVLPQKTNEVAFAGNLFKSEFINELNKVIEVQFHLYGKLGNNIKPPSNVQYHGVFTPYDLPQQIKGSYGLVWDGDSVDGSTGVFGEYIKYISPHKLSLYILAGLPLIAHTSSASAELINKYKIGIVVDSLINLNEHLISVTDSDYKNMQEACKALALKISSGGCITEAIKKHLQS
jgi:hypothetical protein